METSSLQPEVDEPKPRKEDPAPGTERIRLGYPLAGLV